MTARSRSAATSVALVVAILAIAGCSSSSATSGGSTTPTTRGSSAPIASGSSTPTTSGSSTPTKRPPKFQLFQFDDSPSSLDAGPSGRLGAIFHGTPLANDPDVSGGLIIAEWVDLEPTKGVINFNVIDQAMAPWVAAHKKVAIEVMTDAEGVAATPSWVTSDTVAEPAAQHGGTAPVFWDPDFLSAYHQLIVALAAHYDDNRSVAWIQAGLALDGEGNIDTSASYLPSLWEPKGFTNTVWNNTVGQILGMYINAFKRTPIVAVPGQICAKIRPPVCQAATVDQISSLGVWLQNDALKSTTVQTNPNWSVHPLVEEQLQATRVTGDSFAGEVNAAIAAKASYFLGFASDIANPANRSILDQVTQ
jgi:hypothetical protein